MQNDWQRAMTGVYPLVLLCVGVAGVVLGLVAAVVLR